MMLNSILLDASGATAPANGGGGMSGIIMIVVLIVIFYFFMIRPQNKKQKEERKFREALQAGDKVVTAGGIYGRIRQVKENTVVLEIADNVKITISKGSIYKSFEEQNIEEKKS